MNNGGARLIVVAVAVVVGVVVLTKGLQGSATVVVPPQHSPTTSTSPTSSPTGTATSPGNDGGAAGLPSPQQSGVLIAIYNATNTNGLAQATWNELRPKGYVLAGPLGNLTPSNTTTIYYKNDQGHADANHLKDLAVPEAKVKPLPKHLPAEASIPNKAELVLVLGSDYAQAHPING